jgi:hypothetical protein
LFHDESAAIAQAVDTRARTGVQFEAVQAQTLSEIDTAMARYRAAYTALAETRDAEGPAGLFADDATRRLNAGAADRGEMLTAQLGLALARRANLDALKIATDALGAVEDGVQRPIWPHSTLLPKRPDNPIPE